MSENNASQPQLGIIAHARRLLASIRGRKQTVEAYAAANKGGPAPSEIFRESEPANCPTQGFKEVFLARYAKTLLRTANLVGVVVILILVFSALYASSRTDGVLIASPTLDQAIASHLSAGKKADYARLVLYAKSVLEGLNQIDLEENPLREGLKPLMAPQVWQQKATERQSLTSAFRTAHIIQGLTIKSVEGIVVNEEEHRVRCYVKGFLSLLVLAPPDPEKGDRSVEDGPQPKSRTLPYRAEFVAEVSEANEVNPFEFYMLSLTEKNGKSALSWDRQQTTKK